MIRDFAKVGGKQVKMGKRSVWDFGWVPLSERTDEQMGAHESALRSMPSFRIIGRRRYDETKVCLFDLWKHPEVVSALGFEYPGTHQLTGSCVGAGGGNVEFSLLAWEAVRLRDSEQVMIPFWLLPYGRSRYHSGMRGRGEGSTGSGFAKAARDDGVVPATESSLPKFTNSDALVWGSKAEMDWSAGDQISSDWLSKAKRHLTRTVAPCNSADDVRMAICNGYPCTAASMYAHRPSVTSDPPVLLGRKSGSWAHQMSIQAWWEHPKLGEIFWLHNQWGLDAHGDDPAGGPPGGVWITAKDVDWICRDEAFAFSQFNGFPAQSINWYI